jgi:tetracycline resistance efflux pump
MQDAEWLAVRPIVPTLIVVAAAVATRSTIAALVAGVTVGHLLLDGSECVPALVKSLERQMRDPAVGWILLVCGLFGSLIHLLVRSGGTAALTRLVTAHVRSGRGALMVAWVLGLAIFIDDYLNALLVGHAMRPITDRLRVARERLAYVIDATAAPVCLLVPLSTWAIYVSGLLESCGAAEAGGGMAVYLQLIPRTVYGWVAIALVPLVISGWIPAWGLMRVADQRVAEGGSVAPRGSPAADAEEQEPALASLMADGRLGDFLVPVCVVVSATLLSGGDALQGVAWALATVAVQQGVVRRRFTAAALADGACAGFASMVPALATIVLAFVVKDVNDRLGLTQLVIEAVGPLLDGRRLPALVFVSLSLVTMATGSFWGTYAIALPIVVPLAARLGADSLLTIAAVVSAGGFGSHACLFGDTTVIASQAAGCENLAHAWSQLPYAVLGAVITTAAYLALGMWQPTG